MVAIENVIKLNNLIKKLKNDIISSGYKVIYTSPISKTPLGYKLKGGDTAIYISDLCFILEGDDINIQKNRYKNQNPRCSIDGVLNF